MEHIYLKKERWWANNCLDGEKNKCPLFYAWLFVCTFPADRVRNCIPSYFDAFARWAHLPHLNLKSKCRGMGSMEIFSLVFQSMAEATRTELSEQLLIKWFRDSLGRCAECRTHQANIDIIVDTNCWQPWRNRGTGLWQGGQGSQARWDHFWGRLPDSHYWSGMEFPRAPGLSLLVWLSLFQRVSGLLQPGHFCCGWHACTHAHTHSLSCVCP